MKTAPDERHPLIIEPGLDGADIQVLVEFAPRTWRLLWIALAMGLVTAWLFGPGLGLAATCPTLAVAAYHRRRGPLVLRLRADRRGVWMNGRPVSLTADYQSVTLDGRVYPVVGGLTKGEHRRLSALIDPRPDGDAEDVPQAMSDLRERQ